MSCGTQPRRDAAVGASAYVNPFIGASTNTEAKNRRYVLIIVAIVVAIALVISLPFHECAHAWAASCTGMAVISASARATYTASRFQFMPVPLS